MPKTKPKLKTRPPPPIFPAHKPLSFYRVTDTTSYFRHGVIAHTSAPSPHTAFSFSGPNPGFKHGPLYMTITPETLLLHLLDKPLSEYDEDYWHRYIGFFSSKEELKRELERRKGAGREGIKCWEVDATCMYWNKDRVKREREDGVVEDVEIDVLTDFCSDFGYPVCCVSLEELVKKFGLDLEGRLEEGRDLSAEWVALEWMPIERVKELKDVQLNGWNK